MKKHLLITTFLLVSFYTLFAQADTAVREHLLMDFGWRFAFGHPYDTKKDFDNGTAYFSYFAKAGFGDGAAAANFDDRAWRRLDLPHDWAVEQPFAETASYSHGFKAIGRNFPDASVGWYRKKFTVPASDLGRHITIAFDGVFRNSIVWVNGHYLGTEPSGYAGFEYNISEYLNYGGENTIAVRVDATMEEGWFYEGAGIYRHVWLNKTSPLHVGYNGTFVTSDLKENSADITAQVNLVNDGLTAKTVDVLQTIFNADGKIIATGSIKNISLAAFEKKNVSSVIAVADPHLWSLDTPYLHKLITTVMDGQNIIDKYETSFGIRSIRFDANEGFFLNGKHVKIKGTDNHQDHAGVGSAMPDALQDFRIKTLKSFGCNAYRCSHNPPTPELLDACDRLGMLVIDENRLTGTSSTHFGYLERYMQRDHNHPSVISWSIGNEEWAIENNITGARIATTMQAYVKSLDSTRPATYAFSGGIGSNGITTVMELEGINYVVNKNTDTEHALFPKQKIWGTEEGSTNATRGAYFRDNNKHIIPAYDKAPSSSFLSIENGWKHYAERPYLAGLFIWTGFDYRGEPTPFGWPSTGSYFGMMDQCGFPKDDMYYLKSWWTDKPTLHILPHWNWKGKEGQDIEVWAYSNCDEVELFLNKKSLGKKTMEANSHLEWTVKYTPGILEAIGYKNGKKIITDKVQTTDLPAALMLSADRTDIKANKEDIALVTVRVNDKNNLAVPTADNLVTFSIDGPGKIIGVGNGDPTSLEPDKFIDTIQTVAIESMKEKIVQGFDNPAEITADYNDAQWNKAYKDDRTAAFGDTAKVIIYRSHFTLPQNISASTVTLFYKPIGKEQAVYINGKLIADHIKESGSNTGFVIDSSLLHPGKNSIVIIAVPLLKKYQWDNINMDPGNFQVMTAAPACKRKLFNGFAQVIIQSTGQPGTITLSANAAGVKDAQIKIETSEAAYRPAVPGIY